MWSNGDNMTGRLNESVSSCISIFIMEQQSNTATPPESASSAASAQSKIPAPPATEYPLWWRSSWIPFVVLLLAAAAGDLLAPRATVLLDGEVVLGLGPALGSVALSLAILLSRCDLSRREMVFLGGIALSCGLALAVSGSLICWVMAWAVPLFFLAMVPTRRFAPSEKAHYYTWWSYCFSARRSDRLSRITSLLPWLVSILIGVVLFIFFLCIFAGGNPVVELIWNHITAAWNRLVSFLRIDWDFGVHVLLWVLGILLFGLFTMRRPVAGDAPSPVPVVPGRSILPQVPLMVLLGINAAFMIVNASDMAYLWFRCVPEGVSQTQYLHEGADSIIWASVIASAILIFLFRARGNARRGALTRGLGYLLVGQTILLAGSVFLRLFYQIDDFGFTVRRLVAGEMMLFGLIGLVVLLGYMVGGRFMKSAGTGLMAGLILLALTQVNPPSSLTGDLNMRYGSVMGADGTPTVRWEFSVSDFRSRVPVASNLTFALYTYDHCKNRLSESERVEFRTMLRNAAQNVENRANEEGWFRINWMTQRDIPAAERILGHPIAPKPVEVAH